MNRIVRHFFRLSDEELVTLAKTNPGLMQALKEDRPKTLRQLKSGEAVIEMTQARDRSGEYDRKSGETVGAYEVRSADGKDKIELTHDQSKALVGLASREIRERVAPPATATLPAATVRITPPQAAGKRDVIAGVQEL